MIEYLIVVGALVAVVMIPIQIARLRKLSKRQRDLEDAALQRGSIPPPLPK